LLPLAACKYLGWPLASTLTRRDGYEPGDLNPHLSTWLKFTAPLFGLITVPSLLQKRNTSTTSPRLRQRPELAASLHRGRLKRLRKTLHAVAPKPSISRWSEYPQTADHYTQVDREKKRDFVQQVLSTAKPKNVLDIGANTGEYSRLAAESGASVVAWDTDIAATERNWQIAFGAKLPILPLVADIARPTPALGWRNAESISLLDRSRGRFDCIMMLGIIHHLLLADQIPLDEIAHLAAELTSCWAIVEWVPRTDPRFKDVCRGRDALFSHLNERTFLKSFSRVFSPVLRRQLSNGRVLFLLVRKS
jgi:SAM-dependent methyltransferase